VGIGALGYGTDLIDSYSGQVINNSVDINNGRSWDMVIPFGLGMKFRIASGLDLGLESGFRASKTDRIDGVAPTFSNNDMYNYTSVGLTFRIGRHKSSGYWACAADAINRRDARYQSLAADYAVLKQELENVENAVIEANKEKQIEELYQMVYELKQNNQQLKENLNGAGQASSTIDAAAISLVNVYFELNKAEFDGANYERVAAIAKFMLANPGINIQVVGHSDQSGPLSFNKRLSKERARAVQSILVSDFGIDSLRLAIASEGSESPASKTNPAINRRVEFRVMQ
jgi:outer membrane protein OmpA-like peptidoglycan-associated protein